MFAMSLPRPFLCLPRSQKSLSAIWSMKAHCLFIQLHVTPDLICTDAIWPICHHPFWLVEWIQWIFIMVHVYVTCCGSFLLIVIATNVPWKCITWRLCHWEKKKHYQQSCVPSFCFIILKSEGKSAQWVAHIGFLCLFVFLLQITIPKWFWQVDFQPGFLANKKRDIWKPVLCKCWLSQW